ncbi:haloacid dehalogenase, type II [Caenispirillum salinarum AK4]|uniref:(S)-2-haloacid dehalogenase n=1 Tax=Caenispirillum salinarum AK4 TaxID=1238182 RepID=K9HK44_9PROT|nr:haloacid dehalogenase type II [Caenispirillum salinarum]EKV30703.1 haloacid dehalogenase, type II [Caenispirillum salinarum AK4]
MAHRPKVVAFDVIETTFSLHPLRDRLEEIGVRSDALPTWFARSLRDAFALAATDCFEPFRSVLEANLIAVARDHGTDPDEAQRDRVLSTFAKLPPHDDARPALEALREAGVMAVALSNGSLSATEALFEGAGLRDMVAHVLSVEDVGLAKPRREVYHKAASACGITPEECALVAAHPWDIHGAAAAGLSTGYVARHEPFPAIFRQPSVTGASLTEVVDGLLALSE